MVVEEVLGYFFNEFLFFVFFVINCGFYRLLEVVLEELGLILMVWVNFV